jgi:hypothetical protein
MLVLMDIIRKLFSHFLIPSENNNFRSRSLHHDYLSLYLLIALVFSFSVKQLKIHNILGFATDISVTKLFEVTNEKRNQSGLSTLSYNQSLSDAAQKKAEDMFAKNYWAHYAPDGKTPWDFILSTGYKYEFAGENLAKNFLFSNAVVDAWMNSPKHRENILKAEYSEVGYAVVNGVLGGEETTLVVQMFGKPLAKVVADNRPPAIMPAAKPVLAEEKILPEPKTLPAAISQENNHSRFSIPAISLNMTYTFIIFLIVALVADFYVAAKLRIVRLSGRNIAHILFLAFIVIGISLIIVKSGIIL